MPPRLLCVVIVNWNLKQDTAECLSSVQLSDHPNYQVLVVDNGSSDGSVDLIRSLHPAVHILPQATNLGFAKAANLGIRKARDGGAEDVFLLNNDTVVDPQMLRRVAATAESAPQAGLIAPMVLYYARRDRIWNLGGRRRRFWPVPLTLGHDRVDDGRYAEPFEVDYVTFCGALVKGEVVDHVGLLDERFVFAYEDSDYCCRVQSAGYRIYTNPAARMWHKVSQSVQKDTARVSYLKSRSRALFYRLHPHGPHPALTWAWVTASTLWGSARHILWGDQAAALAALRGLKDGFRLKPGSS